MSRVSSNTPLMPSLLDRLSSADPTMSRRVAEGQRVSELVDCVRRDLQRMLNTRACCVPWSEELAELSKSLVNYGLPDTSGLESGTVGAVERMRKLMELSIREFDPRFKFVRVVVLSSEDALDRTMRFRIEGELHAQPLAEPVAFETHLDPVTDQFEVRRSRT